MNLLSRTRRPSYETPQALHDYEAFQATIDMLPYFTRAGDLCGIAKELARELPRTALANAATVAAGRWGDCSTDADHLDERRALQSELEVIAQALAQKDR